MAAEHPEAARVNGACAIGPFEDGWTITCYGQYWMIEPRPAMVIGGPAQTMPMSDAEMAEPERWRWVMVDWHDQPTSAGGDDDIHCSQRRSIMHSSTSTWIGETSS